MDMEGQRLSAKVLDRYARPDEARLDAMLKEELDKARIKIVVLDDDPTGVQTVHDVSVYTELSRESIRQGFLEDKRLFYILTNSRSFTTGQTIAVHEKLARDIAKVAAEEQIPYMVMSRSDSTLRGHYPAETETLRRGMKACGGPSADGEIICPFFKEGGRYTLEDVHYVRYGDELVPAADTEFARDATFGYHFSRIPYYVEEKTKGRYRAEEVTSISLERLRSMDVDGIVRQLTAVRDFNKVVVNAADYCDLKVFAIALYRAVAAGKHFIFRTAASLVKVMGGIPDRPLLTRDELILEESPFGGIVVVGSHTQKTTAQLEELLTLKTVEGISFHSDLVLEGEETFYAEVDRVVRESERIMRTGRTAVCFTSRKLLTRKEDSKEEALLRSVRISDGVQALVGRLKLRPSFVVAKGGITSSDVGTKALKVKRADVIGQIRPGIPVWRTGGESRSPKIPYVIFPGNVGEKGTLKEVVQILTGQDC